MTATTNQKPAAALSERSATESKADPVVATAVVMRVTPFPSQGRQHAPCRPVGPVNATDYGGLPGPAMSIRLQAGAP